MQVQSIHIYPVKSLAGFSPSSAKLEPQGFQYDRRWMLVDPAGRFISQREHAQLCRWQAKVIGTNLVIRNMDEGQQLIVEHATQPRGPVCSVSVWDDRLLAHEVDKASSTELAKMLGMECRLVYLGEKSQRPVDPRYAKANETVSFADGYPYLVVNTASLVTLDKDVDVELVMDRFRPNIVVDGATAFEEDAWQQLTIGGQPFRLTKPCARCIVITIDPTTGKKSPQVFRALHQLHRNGKKTLFGMNACWEGDAGDLKVGDEVVLSS